MVSLDMQNVNVMLVFDV